MLLLERERVLWGHTQNLHVTKEGIREGPFLYGRTDLWALVIHQFKTG